MEWQTADVNACEECAGYAADSPYPLDALPAEPPAHPWCGCMLLPADFGTDDDWEYTDEELAEMGEKAIDPDVVKVRRVAVDDALARLAEIPDDTPGLIAVPWPIAERVKVPTEAWANSELQLLPIESLCATQRHLNRETVAWHLNNLGQVGEGINANPNVLIVDDEPRIHDGHHRLAALWLLNVIATNCWTLEV
jgi:hypothetical protein